MAFELDPYNKRGTKRRTPKRGSSSFDNPLNNRDGSQQGRTPTKATTKGAFGGDYIGGAFGGRGGKKAGAKGDSSGKGKPQVTEARAARAVLKGLRSLSKTTGSAAVSLRVGGRKSETSAVPSAGDSGGRASGAQAPPAKSGQSRGGSGRAASAVARSQEKPKPGKAYEKTRSYWKDEGEKSKRFDMEMTGDEIRAARNEFLRTHPAARRAVKNGTMSMGDVNIMVRRLSKRKKSRQG